MATATQSIILAAGRGSRMGDLTAAQPKCLTQLAGKSLLDWQLSAIRTAGISRITVIGGYRMDLLVADDIQLLRNPDWATTNMVATLRCASELLHSAPCVISYADIVYRPDRVRTLASSDADISISYDTEWESLWRARFANPLADAETFRQRDGWLLAIGERAESMSDIEGQYMGLLKFTPAGWRAVEQLLSTLAPDLQRRIDMTRLLGLLIGNGVAIRCVAGKGAWCEVDNGDDVHLYQRLLKEADEHGRSWSHDWRW